MIRVPDLDGLTQARHPREIDDIANFPARSLSSAINFPGTAKGET